MVPRSLLTNLPAEASVRAGAPLDVRGIAFGGDCGVKAVEVSPDGGRNWMPASLGTDEGTYSFRRFEARLPALAPGRHDLKVRCTSTKGAVQPLEPTWNPNGFMRSVVETTPVIAS
ncbi:hypothetical protein MBTS_17980 [Methylobacterium bullatum]|nr:hypothetical protein [Methylobacterium bullatum]